MPTPRHVRHDDVVALLREVAPTDTDYLAARSYVLERLSREAATERALSDGFIKRNGVSADRRSEVSIQLDDPGWREAALNAPAVVAARMSDAVRHVIAELHRDGVIAPLAAGERGDVGTSVPVRTSHGSGGTRGSATIPLSGFALAPGTGAQWALVEKSGHPRQVFGRADLAADFDALLGSRGIEVLREALACFRAGRYLASVDLLAAASEAAWHGIARAARGQDEKLDRLVETGTNAAEVIDRTFELLQRGKVIERRQLNDVRAQAARFRDIRNYGLHPVGGHDSDREDAFTEAGATVLFMTVRRYLSVLSGIHEVLRRADSSSK